MKRIIVLFIALFLLLGCGADQLTSDNLTNAIGQAGNNSQSQQLSPTEIVELKALNLSLDIYPQAGTNVAQAHVRIELEEGAFIWGGKSHSQLYAAGVLEVEDSNFKFSDHVVIQSEGSGQVVIFSVESKGESDPPEGFLIFPTLGLTAQIDGLKAGPTSIEMVGIGATSQETQSILATNENITEFSSFKCHGRAIPDSNLVMLAYTAETQKGEALIGSAMGIIPETPIPSTFECEADAGAAFKVEIDGIEGAQTYGIMFETFTIGDGNGQSTSLHYDKIEWVFMSTGFNIGMPPALSFNIGMPPK